MPFPAAEYKPASSPLAASQPRHKVVVLSGDGIGPEVVDATMRVLNAAGAPIDWEVSEAGASLFARGVETGVPQAALDAIESCGVALKGPLETPIGFGNKSANVTLRKLFELYANVRPVRELPNVKTPFYGRNIDFVVVRENVEDLYAGIEYMQTPNVAQCLKLMSRKGCRKIMRFAMELARAEGRKTLHTATKANIMKMTEGLMKQAMEDLLPAYPDIKGEHLLIDNCAHQMVIAPEQFEVIVTSNMNGDIISDLGAGLVGGLGVAPSANIGAKASMFEAVHGSAPQIAGKGLANPTALLLSAVMMLRHLEAFEHADLVEQAVLLTLANGLELTGDLAPKGQGASTNAFVDRIISNLGSRLPGVEPRLYSSIQLTPEGDFDYHPANRELIGVDVFIDYVGDVYSLGHQLEAHCRNTIWQLKLISSRGTVVYPENNPNTDLVDHWRCRFTPRDSSASNLADREVQDLLGHLAEHVSWMHIEKLYRFDGKDSFSKAQGES
jgi:isocitrate dehydrogenase